MTFCAGCGKETPPEGSFCPSCGAPQGAAREAGPLHGGAAGEGDLGAFVGDKAGYYLPRFAGFTAAGLDNYAVTWHWPAFFAPFFWMLYRKLYLWAVVSLFTGFLFPLNRVGWAVLANYLYYKEAKGKAAQVRAANPGGDVPRLLAELGGVNRWVWPLAIVLAAAGLLVCAALGLIGCLAYLGSSNCGGSGVFGNG